MMADYSFTADSIDDHLPVDCALAWSTLVEGRTLIIDSGTTAERTFLTLARASEKRQRLNPRSVTILERFLLGEAPKVIASSLNLATSTVATTMKHGLESLGLSVLPSRVPPALQVLVHHARNHPATLMRCEKTLVGTVLFSAPFTSLSDMLPPAVVDVLALRLQGKSHSAIAAFRRTSARTIANQLAEACRRLGVSGRGELIEYVIGARGVRACANT